MSQLLKIEKGPHQKITSILWLTFQFEKLILKIEFETPDLMEQKRVLIFFLAKHEQNSIEMG